MVFGSNPVDPLEWEDREKDLLSAQDSSIPGRPVQQWKLRMMAQEAALREAATRKLRRLLAYNRSLNCTGEKSGDTAL